MRIKSIFLALIMSGIMLACNTNENCADLGTCPGTSLIERTDISIDGALSIADHQIFEVNGAKQGPVYYNYYGNPSESFDFLIDLSSGFTLTIRMHNEESLNPWTDVNVPYNTYPTQDLEDKYQYVTADLRMGNDAAAYSTNIGSDYPMEIKLDVFKITLNDGELIKCRIRDLELFNNTDSGQTININGTFTAVIAHDEDLS